MGSYAETDLHATSMGLSILIPSRAIILLKKGSQGCDNIAMQKYKHTGLSQGTYTRTASNKPVRVITNQEITEL